MNEELKPYDAREFFKNGQRVKYIPGHAFGDAHNKDCEIGLVYTVNKDTVFVVYNRNPFQPVATKPEDLIIL